MNMDSNNKSTLILYFSSGDGRETLTQKAAQVIADETGATLFAVTPEKPYSEGYAEAMKEARADQQSGARPAVCAYPDTLDGIDVVYLGYPNYWGTCPMAVLTLLEHCDFSGKAIRPFCLNDGGGLGYSLSDIRKSCPGAAIGDGLSIASDAFDEKAIRDWVKAGE